MPRGTVGAEIPEQSGFEQGRDFGTLPDLACLPGVERKCCVPVGQRQPGCGQSGRELDRGHDAPALGPCRVGGEKGRSDSQPVQRKGAAQLR